MSTRTHDLINSFAKRETIYTSLVVTKVQLNVFRVLCYKLKLIDALIQVLHRYIFMNVLFYYIDLIAERPGVARGKKF